MHFDTQKSILRSRLKHSILATHNWGEKRNAKISTAHALAASSSALRKEERQEEPPQAKIPLTPNHATSYTGC